MRPLLPALVALPLWAGCTGDAPAPVVQPNVLLVSVDTVRADRLSHAGHERDTTPAMQRLSQRGAWFSESHSQAPSTVPSHASMFTGTWIFRHQVLSFTRVLEPTEQTLAEHLQAAGYRSFAAVSSFRFKRESGFPQGFDRYETFWGLDKNDRSAAVNAVATEELAAGADRPVFGFLHYYDAHAPYAPPEPHRTRFHAGGAAPAPEDTVAFIAQNARRPGGLPAPQVAYLEGLYDGGLSYLDQQIAWLAEDIPAANGRPTLVVLTSDHGDAFMEHGYLGHSNHLYEEIMRVPLIVSWPGVVVAGQRLDVPVENVDLLPTILDLVGLPVPDGLDGQSLAPALKGLAQPVSQVGEVRDVTVVQETLKHWAIIGTLPTGRFKLLRRKGGVRRLFRLSDDPEANRDVSEQYPEERKALLQAAKAVGLRDAKKRASNKLELDKDELEMLKAMGYVGEVEDNTP